MLLKTLTCHFHFMTILKQDFLFKLGSLNKMSNYEKISSLLKFRKNLILKCIIKKS